MHCEHRRKIIIIVAFSLDVGAIFESIPWFSVELKITLYKDVFHYKNINPKIYYSGAPQLYSGKFRKRKAQCCNKWQLLH